jgi:hypothetical protein
MQNRGKGAAAGRLATIIVSLLAVVVLAPPTQAADEYAGRNFGHTQKVEMIEVGDVPGHFMGVSRFHGLSFYTKGPDSGEVAARMGTTTFDIVNGKGTMTGHEVKTFKDGSTLSVRFGGTQTPIDQGKKTAYEGTWDVTGGTGRYAGAKGSGTYKGERIGDFKTGADNYVDFTGTLTK